MLHRSSVYRVKSIAHTAMIYTRIVMINLSAMALRAMRLMITTLLKTKRYSSCKDSSDETIFSPFNCSMMILTTV